MDKEQAVSYVQLLQGYIDQTSQYINQYLPYPKDGSPGYIELENFSRQESVHTSHSLGSTLIETSADHMQALVKTLTEPVQAFAPWVCLRSVLESSALAYWILDNNIDIRTRVKRGFALRYKGLVQQINIARAMDDVGFENRINEQIEKVEKTALQLGYDKILNRNNNRIGIGVGMPSFTEIVKITFNAEGVYRYLSSISHSHHWAIKQVGFQEVNADEVEIKTMPSTRIMEKGLLVTSVVDLCQSAIIFHSKPLWQKSNLFGWDLDQLYKIQEDTFSEMGIDKSLHEWGK